MSGYPTCRHSYVISESPKEIIVRCHMAGKGLMWEFRILQRPVIVPLKAPATTLRLIMSTASWEAFTDVPSLFEALSLEVPDSLQGARAVLDQLNFDRE